MDVFLTVSDRPLGIPYYKDTQDSTSSSYIDLRSEPHRIGEVPEARTWPSLHRLLLQLNAPESQLMSLGCGVFIYSPEHTGQLQWSAYSYVGYVFADITLATDASVYFPQFFHFSRHFAARTGTGANVFFELRQASFIERSAGAFVVDYGVRSFAQSQEQLPAIVADHFNALSDFLPRMGLTAPAASTER